MFAQDCKDGEVSFGETRGRPSLDRCGGIGAFSSVTRRKSLCWLLRAQRFARFLLAAKFLFAHGSPVGCAFRFASWKRNGNKNRHSSREVRRKKDFARQKGSREAMAQGNFPFLLLGRSNKNILSHGGTCSHPTNTLAGYTQRQG